MQIPVTQSKFDEGKDVVSGISGGLLSKRQNITKRTTRQTRPSNPCHYQLEKCRPIPPVPFDSKEVQSCRSTRTPCSIFSPETKETCNDPALN